MKILDPSIRLAEHGDLCAIGVMAKAPRPGKVKTRLSPPLTPDEAAELNICFLRDTLLNISQVQGAVGIVVYTPAGDEAAFDGNVPAEFSMLPQRGDDFGARLLAASQDLLACGFGSCCLIDSDSPTVPHQALQHAANALSRDGDRIVLGPTEDGGYYLVGAKSTHAGIFANISWSTPAVFDQTMERADALALDVTLVQRWYDVDDGVALERLCEEMFCGGKSSEGYAAPHTREYLAKLLQTGSLRAPSSARNGP